MGGRVRDALRSEFLIRAADAVFLRRRPKPADGSRALLIAPPGRGNIGDQALVEAFVESVGNFVIVVVRENHDIVIPDHLADRMQLIALPALIYGTAIGRARDVRKLERALKQVSSVSIIGADIMDGAYVPRASVNRAALAERLARLGWPTRVLGFSWNSSPRPAARKALLRAQRAGVLLLVRDPLSAARARADGLVVTDTADIVFTASSRDDDVRRQWPTAGPYAVVNASGLVGSDGSVVDEYARIVDFLRRRGLTVLVLPHVSRPGADDLPLCTAITERATAISADAPSVQLIPRLLSPSQIRSLAGAATVVVTGRMHLAVMSLMAGTPAITLATQGKVEGLMSLFDAPELCVEPGPHLDQRVIEVLTGVLIDEPQMRAALLSRLSRVTGLAENNVDGLRSPARAAA